MGNGPVGLVLAAGAGRRFGAPKAAARRPDGTPWLVLAVDLLRAAGCADVVVVLGAGAEDARPLLPHGAAEVVASAWASGMGASLAAGIAALPEADAALITLVDLPHLPVAVAHRVLAGGTDSERLARAVFDGRPGHPVLVGRAHWSPLRSSLSGDSGGRGYLGRHGVERIECGDLADGRDIDRPEPGD